MKVCKICGKTIEFTSKAKKYCSPECRARVKYEKDRDWLAAHPGKSAEYGRKFYAVNTERCKQASREAYRRQCLAQMQKGKE